MNEPSGVATSPFFWTVSSAPFFLPGTATDIRSVSPMWIVALGLVIPTPAGTEGFVSAAAGSPVLVPDAHEPSSKRAAQKAAMAKGWLSFLNIFAFRVAGRGLNIRNDDGQIQIVDFMR